MEKNKNSTPTLYTLPVIFKNETKIATENSNDTEVIIQKQIENYFSDDLSKCEQEHSKDKLLPPQVFKCQICKKSFKNLPFLINHLKRKIHQKAKQCGICGEQFETCKFVKEHLKNVHSINFQTSLMCNFCPKTLSTGERLAAHIKLHLNERPFKCNLCPKSYVGKKGLKNHERTHKEKNLKCPHCPKKFHWELSFKRHVNTQHENNTTTLKEFETFETVRNLEKFIQNKEKPDEGKNIDEDEIEIQEIEILQCHICLKKLSNIWNLQRHIKNHSNTKTSTKPYKYKCKICSKKFQTEFNLKRHISETHELTGDDSKDPLKYKCNMCKKRFHSYLFLESHMASHTGEKPYVCKICGDSFAVGRTLKQHWLRHTKERAFKCDHCGQTYKRMQTLRRHLQTVHAKEKDFVCEFCEKKFTRKDVLFDHLRAHTGEKPYQCDKYKCHEKFTSSMKLRYHKLKDHY